MFTILSSLILVSFTTGYRSVATLTSGGGGSEGFSPNWVVGRTKEVVVVSRHKSHAHHHHGGGGQQHVIDVPFADDSDKHNYKASHGGKSSKRRTKTQP